MTARAHDGRRSSSWTSWKGTAGTNTSAWGAELRMAESGITAFDLNRAADWLAGAQTTLRVYQGLTPNWDGHGGRSVAPGVAFFAGNLLAETTTAHTPAPQLVPLSYGGVQIEWHEKGMDIEIEVSSLGQIYASCEDRRDDRNSFAEEFSADYTKISAAIRVLTNRR